MHVHTPWMMIAGCSIVGFLLPELLVAFGKVRVPQMMNIVGAVAGGLIAASFVG